MTPQLQQAIRLLQLSTLDLQQEIQEALDSNPLLEVPEDEPEQAREDSAEQQHTASDGPLQSPEQSADDTSTDSDDWDTSSPDSTSGRRGWFNL